MGGVSDSGSSVAAIDSKALSKSSPNDKAHFGRASGIKVVEQLGTQRPSMPIVFNVCARGHRCGHRSADIEFELRDTKAESDKRCLLRVPAIWD